MRGYIIGGPVYTTDAQPGLARRAARVAASRASTGASGSSGYVADTAQAMRALDVVVHASTEPEPFGLVIAEAHGVRAAPWS